MYPTQDTAGVDDSVSKVTDEEIVDVHAIENDSATASSSGGAPATGSSSELKMSGGASATESSSELEMSEDLFPMSKEEREREVERRTLSQVVTLLLHFEDGRLIGLGNKIARPDALSSPEELAEIHGELTKIARAAHEKVVRAWSDKVESAKSSEELVRTWHTIRQQLEEIRVCEDALLARRTRYDADAVAKVQRRAQRRYQLLRSRDKKRMELEKAARLAEKRMIKKATKKAAKAKAKSKAKAKAQAADIVLPPNKYAALIEEHEKSAKTPLVVEDWEVQSSIDSAEVDFYHRDPMVDPLYFYAVDKKRFAEEKAKGKAGAKSAPKTGAKVKTKKLEDQQAEITDDLWR